MNKNILLIILTTLIVLPIFVSAGIPHSVYGFLSGADGATVTVSVESRPSEVLTDIVGVNGDSKVEGGWLIDAGNFPTPWRIGDTLIIEFSNQNAKRSTTLILNDAGAQEVNNINSIKTTAIAINNNSNKATVNNVNSNEPKLTEPNKMLQQGTINNPNKTETNNLTIKDNNKMNTFINLGYILISIIILLGVILLIKKFKK